MVATVIFPEPNLTLCTPYLELSMAPHCPWLTPHPTLRAFWHLASADFCLTSPLELVPTSYILLEREDHDFKTSGLDICFSPL